MTLVATGGDEVEMVGLLVTFEVGGHGGTSSLHSHPSQNAAKDGAPGEEGVVLAFRMKAH